ncbi:MAG: hypothetical protein A3I86_01635 [Candidatus Zambryskibacteria bacterium RIFCSPLOWO2_02_FULL_39_14]|uniref:Recombinase domain-containing protein n=1 Tax=Candidatus Zambryskibacteria bacterium RIFCSPLOWO2_02_FULL_39_14 TaxID=1802769 RepID=A0A1G2UIY6_9BACT|nr:MAG: hypothetical protein A3A56_01015 [Candidatus Roizmanbacteria bacterium RIFCSPLOWO2_01_FULL_40_32]OHB09394.1 MAG: hypothetical protein A3I86_01635 [Candidatus Zambryskibacteria bacterium RIFCSPLOWO2_02_FULL_39_14]
MENKSNAIKYFAYCRKSTEDEDRQVLSLDSQETELKELATHYGLKVVGKPFRESKSAKAPDKRPVFSEMISRIKKGEANGILCWKVDRISRNPIDSATIQWLLQTETIRSIHTVGREYLSEDNSVIFSVESSMANEYIRQLSKNVRRGLKAKLAMGWYPSRAPLGYKNSERDEDKGRNWILKDPERFDAVRRMWDLMLTGRYTPPQIVEIANEEWEFKTRPTKRHPGLKPLSRSNIYKVFTNPFYYGMFEYGKGENRKLYQGKHEPMITEKEYDIVQKLLGRDGRPRPQRHRFAFTGLMRCGNCGAMITAEEKIKQQKNGNIHHYIYYRCTKQKDPNCQERAVELKELNGQIDAAIKKLAISEKFKSWAVRYLHDIRQVEAQTHELALKNSEREHLRITQQLDNLLLKYSSPENAEGQFISDQQYQDLRTRLLNQKAALESNISVQNREIEEWLELSERTFNFARYAHTWFSRGDMETKRAIFACLGSHLVIRDQKVAITLRPAFKTIFEALPKVEREIAQIRTYPQLVFSASNKDKVALVGQHSSNWRRG